MPRHLTILIPLLGLLLAPAAFAHRGLGLSNFSGNRLGTMTEGGNRTTQYRYDLNGNIVQKTMPNGDVENITFDALNRSITQSVFPANSTTPHQQYHYSYDLVGNVVQIAEEYPGGMNGIENRIVTNLYDAVNRLGVEFVTTTGSGGATPNTISTTYTYDAANNRTKRIIDGGINAGITDYIYNAFNQLTTYTEKELNGTAKKTTAITYDASGNRSQSTTRDANNTIIKSDAYTFDQTNRLTALTQVHNGISKTYKYEYDYRTRRVIRDESLAGGVKTTVSFSGGTSVQEYEDNAILPTVENIRGSDYGGGVGGLLYTIRNNQPSYTYENKRGDVIAKTDSSGLLTYQATYEAFGTRTQEQGNTLDRQKANTKDEDPTGLLNEGFRYRDLDAGVFISADPAGFVDGPNLYTYVRQNPGTSFDPEGLWLEKITNTAKNVAKKISDFVQKASDKMANAETARLEEENAQAEARQEQVRRDVEWHGGHLPALNAKLNPFASIGLNATEAYTGLGLHSTNGGNDLSNLERLASGGAAALETGVWAAPFIFRGVGAGAGQLEVSAAARSAAPAAGAARVGMADVEAAIVGLERKGIMPLEGQRPIDPSHVLNLAEKMRTGQWNPAQNMLQPPGLIRNANNTNVIIGGHHRQIAEELVRMQGSNFQLEKVIINPGGNTSGGIWSQVERIPGSR